MPGYQVTFSNYIEADDWKSAIEKGRLDFDANRGHIRAVLTDYPDDPELKEYVVEERIVYTVMAYNAQDAIDQVIENTLDPKFQVSIYDREVTGGPEGWEDEEYESS